MNLTKLALDGIVSFSKIPLRMASYFGLLVSIAGFVGICIVLYKKLISHVAILGWSSVLISILFFGGIQLISVGIIGEYVGRIYDEVKKRPLYVIQEALGFDSEKY